MLNTKLDCAGENGYEAAGRGKLGAGLQDTALWSHKITLWKLDHLCFIWILQFFTFWFLFSPGEKFRERTVSVEKQPGAACSPGAPCGKGESMSQGDEREDEGFPPQ